MSRSLFNLDDYNDEDEHHGWHLLGEFVVSDDGAGVSNPVAAGVSNPVAAGVSNPVAAAVSNPVAAGVSNPVAAGVSNPVAAGVSNPVAAGVSNPVAAGVSNPVAAAVSNPVAAAVSNPVAADSTVAVKAVAEGFVEFTEAVKAKAEGFVEFTEAVKAVVEGFVEFTEAVKAVAEGFVEAVAADSTEAVKAAAEGFVEFTEAVKAGAEGFVEFTEAVKAVAERFVEFTEAVKAVAERFVEAVAGDSTEAVKAVAEGFVAPKGVAGQKHSANQIVARASGRAVPALTIADKVNEDAAFPGIKWLFRDDMWIEFTKLLSQLSAEKEIRILMVGLKAAGKTTILHKLQLGEIVTTIPAVGFNVETVQYRNITFTVWDVECPDHTRQLWRSYFQNTEGIIFVVDSNDRDQVGKARRELHRMLNEDGLKEAVVLLFANKGDLPNAFGAPEITDGLAVHGLPQRRWYILTCCATSGEGLYEGLDWLFSNIASNA